MMTRGTVWFIGVFGVVALTGGAVAWKARPIERRIEQSAASELKRRGLDRRIEALQLDVKGRDLTLAGTALSADDRKAALEAAAAAPGAGHVVAEIGLAPEIKPFVFRVVRNTDGGATLDGAAPGPEAAEKLSALGRSLFGGEITASLRMARGAPAGDWHAAATLAVEVIALVEQGDAVLSDNALSLRGRVRDDAALDAATAAFSRGLPDGFRGSHDLFTALDEDLRGGPLTTAGPCQALVDKVMAGQSIRFAPGTAALSEVKPRLLERLARATRRCGTLYLQIYAVSDIKAGDAAANLQLGEARARTLADALAERGGVRARLAALGRGYLDPHVRAGGPELELRFSDSAVPMASPFAWRIEKGADGNAVITGHHPSADAESALAALARPAARGSVTDASRIAHGAPPGDWLGAARLAIEAVAELESGAAVLSDTELLVRGVAKDDAASRAVQSRVAERTPAGFRSKFELTTVLDEELKGPAIVAAERCQGLLESVSGTETVEFVFDGPALHARQRRFFERVAAAMARCPGFAVEIGAHTSGSGDPDAARALSDRWAQAAAEALVRAGVGRGRLRAVGHGNTRPVADGATEAGRQRNRRIVFRIVT